jgi:hypothetical protein
MTLCCGTTPKSDDEKAMLFFYDTTQAPNQDGTTGPGQVPPCLGVAVASQCSAIYVVWQPKTNQILCR